MLSHLSIRNLIFIDKADIEFSDDLNIITGETGAGKSIFIGALKLCLGEKGTSDMIRPGADSLKVTAVFDIADDKGLLDYLQELDIDTEDGQLHIRREINSAGRSKSFINDTPFKLATLKLIGGRLLDIHGQHQNQLLFREKSHGLFFDRFLELGTEVQQYRDRYRSFLDLKKQYDELLESEKNLAQEKEFLEFTVKELGGALMTKAEYQDMKDKLSAMENSAKYDSLLHSAENTISEVTGALDNIIQSFHTTVKENPKFEQLLSRINEARYSLEDARSVAAGMNEGSDGSPADIDDINQRLAKAERLQKKYGATLDDLSIRLSDAQDRLAKLDNIEADKAELLARYKDAAAAAVDVAAALHVKRKEGVKKFSERLRGELDFLGMAAGSLSADLEVNENEDGVLIKFRKAVLNERGLDKVRFIYSPAKESGFKRLSETASGGEISRIMLALKYVLYENLPLHTMVFDEIDTGIGGNTAVNVGKKIQELSAKRQMIVITHLPQIARYADTHILIEKSAEADRTQISIQTLSDQQKVAEISRMISGNTGEADMEYAREFLSSR